MRRRGIGRRAPGQAIVEFAMTAMVFLGLVFAIADFAIWLHAQNAATGRLSWPRRPPRVRTARLKPGSGPARISFVRRWEQVRGGWRSPSK